PTSKVWRSATTCTAPISPRQQWPPSRRRASTSTAKAGSGSRSNSSPEASKRPSETGTGACPGPRRWRDMSNIVRAAIVQTEWTGDSESMVDKHVKYAEQAANDGARVMCFQEIFNTPYFCQVQENEHVDSAEPIPDGPTMEKMIHVARDT